MNPTSQPVNLDPHNLAALAAQEVEAVIALLAQAAEVQYDPSMATAAQDPAARRAVGGYADPTAEVATDEGRLYVRTVLGRSTPHLREALIRLRGVRRGLERAITRWEGEAL